MICSHKIDSYRNKVEFTIGRKYNIVEQCVGDVCVGFNVGDSSKGINYVDSPENTRVNSEESIIAAKRCEAIVRASGLEPFIKSKIEGFWRILLYRESSITNQALISFVVSEGIEVTADLKKIMVE